MCDVCTGGIWCVHVVCIMWYVCMWYMIYDMCDVWYILWCGVCVCYSTYMWYVCDVCLQRVMCRGGSLRTLRGKCSLCGIKDSFVHDFWMASTFYLNTLWTLSGWSCASFSFTNGALLPRDSVFSFPVLHSPPILTAYLLCSGAGRALNQPGAWTCLLLTFKATREGTLGRCHYL